MNITGRYVAHNIKNMILNRQGAKVARKSPLCDPPTLAFAAS